MSLTLESKLKDILKKVGVTYEVSFSAPPKPEMGDLAFACFDIAKKEGKNPSDVATEIAQKLNACLLARQGNLTEIIKEVKAFGPYVNFYLDAGEVSELILGEVDKKDFGENNLGDGRKVMVEYPSQNTHKEFHVGHLRNVCIGSTLINLYKKSGYQVVPVNYINDFGSHVVKCLWWILKNYRTELINHKTIDNKQKWLGEIYAEASNYIKEHEAEVKPELDELQKKLEKRDKEIFKLFKETRQWSLIGFDKINKELGLQYKQIFLESEVKDWGQKVVDELLQKGIAKIGDGGAIIVDLNEYKLDIALLRKSTGAGVYMTSDLGLAEKKFTKYSVSESINITGAEQIFYFQQLFKVLELNGFKNKMTHIAYGLVTRPEGKMSSRLGNVILYEDLRDEVYEKIVMETKSRHTDWSEKKIKSNSLILTMAAIKFEFLKHEAAKNIVFDSKAATSFDGFTGPYVLYTVARINSLLKKSPFSLLKTKNFSLLKTDEEKRLSLFLEQYGSVVEKALENYNPSVIVKYCFDLAQAFNDFYTKHSVLSNDKDLVLARLALSELVQKVLIDALKLLSIETVEEM